MTKPAEKSPEIIKVLNDIAKDHFGTNREESIYNNTCVSCKEIASSFKDELSKKEYTISGLCQRCQDDVFE